MRHAANKKGRPLAVLVVARHAMEDTPAEDDTSVSCVRAALLLLVCAALAACADDGGRLSIAEGLKCAVDEFSNHGGRFSLGDNAIAYSYETANGPARVIVVFDGRRRPVRTLFERAPRGSHQELMDAAEVIKDCVAYGPKARQGQRHEHD